MKLLFSYFQNQFLKRLLILFVHLFFLSISVYTRPVTENLQNKLEEESQTVRTPTNENPEGDETDDDDSLDVTTIIRYISEVCTLIGVLSYVIFQQGDEIKNQGFSAFMKQLVTYYPDLLNSRIRSSYQFLNRPMLPPRQYF